MPNSKVPSCPKCGRTMVLRIARQGRHAGERFWGCSGFPECRKTLSLDEHPIPSKFEENNFSTNNTELLDLDPIPTQENKHFEMLTEVNLESEKSTHQVRFFQTITSHRSLVELLHINRTKISRDQILGYSQWRLDYPKITAKQNDKHRSTLVSLEKLLLRGSIVPTTPLLEDLAFNKQEFDDSPDRLLFCFDIMRRFERSPYKPITFGSQAEETFYELLSDNYLIEPWISCQIPVSTLTKGNVDPQSKQRVDFLLSRPGNKSIVIEIDGPQHAKQTLVDQERDRQLEEAGFTVVRIAANKVETIDFDNHPIFSKFEICSYPEWYNDEPVIYPEMWVLHKVRAISQIQIAILEAIKTGILSLSKMSRWNICIKSPAWLIERFEYLPDEEPWWQTAIEYAVVDVIEMLKGLYLFQNNEEIEVELSLSVDKSDSGADVVIAFADSNLAQIKTPNTFIISDVFIPVEIAQPIPESQPIVVSNPQESSANYFFRYLFGKEDFREKQWEAIARVVQAKDSILLLPTGHGKSMVFQLASFLLPGVCLVIDPLLSLIDDQIDNLGRHGIDRAVGITSLLSQSERVSATASFSKAHYHFTYMSPERFQIKEFRDALEALVTSRSISVIVIDEAHCVSEWGHDFRVSYLNIARNARNYTTKKEFIPPILAMTGTASRSVLRDMRRELEINSSDSLISLESFDRPELNFKVIRCPTSEKFDKLEYVLHEIPGYYSDDGSFYELKGKETNAGLIFMPHANGKLGVGTVFNFLKENGFDGQLGVFSGKPVKPFTDTDWDRRKQHEAHKFKNNEKNILVCTNAFGMGIDKENIRFTIHMNLPQSIESAYQEAGRAGRDRNQSWCYFLVSPDNNARINKLLNPNTSLEVINEEMKRVKFDDDDITRQVYFHTLSFAGVDEEISIVKMFLNSFGDLRKKSEFQVPFTEENKTISEKAIHRLLTVGVLNDYEVDYAHKLIFMRLSGFSPEQNLDSYIHYIENYDSKMAKQERFEAMKSIGLSHNAFVTKLLERLIKYFIYDVIEQSRRRSLSEMLQACQGNVTNDSFRQRILSYFNLSHYSSLVEKSMENFEYLTSNLSNIIDEITVPIEAAELRGQASRQLEAYPKNPPLLLLRSLAEVFCTDRRKDVVFENFIAFMNFSSTAWGRQIEDTIAITSKFINSIGEIDPELAEELVVATMETAPSKFTQDYLLENCKEEYSSYLIDKMLENIVEKIDTL